MLEKIQAIIAKKLEKFNTKKMRGTNEYLSLVYIRVRLVVICQIPELSIDYRYEKVEPSSSFDVRRVRNLYHECGGVTLIFYCVR